MSESGGILSIPYSVLRERVPRFDQQARIAWKCVDLIYKNGVGNLRDLILPQDQPDDEDRMAYVARRASERQEALEPQVESYVLEKGFGTNAARAMIRHRQEHPPQTEPDRHSWLP